MGEDYDVVIIGAGLSGLVTAYTVLKQKPDTKLLILESTDHIGGPIVTKDMKTANGTAPYDIGCWRAGSAQEVFLEFLKELGLETYDMYAPYHGIKSTKFWQMPDGTMLPFIGSIPPLPYTSLLDLLRYTRKVDGLCKDMNLEDPAASANAVEWDTTTVEEFRKSVLWTEVGRQTVDSLVITFFSMNISELKLTPYLYAIASDGGWDNHSDKDRGRKFNQKLKGGWRALCTKLVQEIDECNIAKNERVTRVTQDDGSRHASITTTKGKQYKTKTVVCTVPPHILGAIEFDPVLPNNRMAAFPHLYPRINFVLTYTTPFWRDDGKAGELFSMSGCLNCLHQEDKYPVINIFDHSDHNGNAALAGSISGPGSFLKTHDERKYMILRYLKDPFGDKVMEPLEYQELNFTENYEGEPPSHDAKPSEILSSFRTPHGRVYWSGSYTATKWIGSLAGALQAGRRAAEEVLTDLNKSA